MRIKHFSVILVISMLTLQLYNCSKDDIDPCDSLKPTTSIIVTGNVFNIFGKMTYFEEDTFIKGSTIKFTVADQDVDSCKWKVGNHFGTITEKTFNLTFNEAYGDIQIRLIVYKKPFTDCYPSDDGIDTSYKPEFGITLIN